MPVTLAFDIYATIINTHGVLVELEKHLGERARTFSEVWRTKQLEYSYRRGLMRNYESFAVCTSHALDYTCSFFKQNLSRQARNELLALYEVLPAFDDAREGLSNARNYGFRIFAFSNGKADAVEKLLEKAGIGEFFQGIISVDNQRSFKPDPGVYCHFLRQAKVSGTEAWLISSNPFDVIGALSAGMHSAWIQRSPDELFDPWGIKPTLTVDNLSGLAEEIAAVRNKS